MLVFTKKQAECNSIIAELKVSMTEDTHAHAALQQAVCTCGMCARHNAAQRSGRTLAAAKLIS